MYRIDHWNTHPHVGVFVTIYKLTMEDIATDAAVRDQIQNIDKLPPDLYDAEGDIEDLSGGDKTGILVSYYPNPEVPESCTLLREVPYSVAG